MERRIADICEKICNRTLDWEEPLIRSGVLDSYLFMELIAILEEEFQIIFEPEEIMCVDNFQNISSMIDIISRKI